MKVPKRPKETVLDTVTGNQIKIVREDDGTISRYRRKVDHSRWKDNKGEWESIDQKRWWQFWK